VRWVEDVEDSLGNRFGFFFIDLPVEEQTVETRLRALKSRMRQSNRLLEASVAFGFLKTLARSGGALERPLSNVFARKASVIVSNVPGPRTPVHFGEKQVRKVMFWEPHPGKLGMAVSILTYAGTIRMGARIDEGIPVDPQRLVALFEAELAAILEGARGHSDALSAAL
jgi:diacylglycerol O-acyltransferase